MGKVPKRMNPQQARAQKVRQNNERFEQLCKNGITPDDVKKACTDAARQAYDQARKELAEECSRFVLNTCYAAALLAAHDEFGFGHARCLRLLQKMDEHVTYSLTTDEIMEQVFEKLGIEINFAEPFDRVTERGAM